MQVLSSWLEISFHKQTSLMCYLSATPELYQTLYVLCECGVCWGMASWAERLLGLTVTSRAL